VISTIQATSTISVGYLGHVMNLDEIIMTKLVKSGIYLGVTLGYLRFFFTMINVANLGIVSEY